MTDIDLKAIRARAKFYSENRDHVAGNAAMGRYADDVAAILAELSRVTAERDSATRGWDESTEAWTLVQAHPAVESADGKLVDHVLAALDNGVVARAIADDAIVQGNREKIRGDRLAALIAAVRGIGARSGTDLNAWNKAFDLMDAEPATALASSSAETRAQALEAAITDAKEIAAIGEKAARDTTAEEALRYRASAFGDLYRAQDQASVIKWLGDLAAAIRAPHEGDDR